MTPRIFWCSACRHDHTHHRPVYVEDDYAGETRTTIINGRCAIRVCSVAGCGCSGNYAMEKERRPQERSPRGRTRSMAGVERAGGVS